MSLKKWMVPDIFRGTDAPDEYSLCLALGDQAKSRLDRHRKTFITAEDFQIKRLICIRRAMPLATSGLPFIPSWKYAGRAWRIMLRIWSICSRKLS